MRRAVVAEITRILAEGKLAPGVYEITVRHDGWCALLNGVGPCNCDPEVCPPERVPSPEEN
jgi:hypothetical protein